LAFSAHFQANLNFLISIEIRTIIQLFKFKLAFLNNLFFVLDLETFQFYFKKEPWNPNYKRKIEAEALKLQSEILEI
jgi:hypothetical protein